MDIRIDEIERLARALDPVFRDSPQFTARLSGRDVLVKVETVNPVRCFKGRGASALADAVERDRTLVCASSGNFGQAMAYACGKRGIPLDVFLPENVNPTKLARVKALGATVHVSGATGDEAKQHAAAYAEQDPARLLVRDGSEVEVAEGNGTIGVELLRAGTLDTVVVPVGDGALINGIGRWLKEHSPHTRVVGVCSTNAQSMVHSWRAGQPVPSPSTTIADGISIGSPLPESVRRMRELVDDMVLVTDEALLTAKEEATRVLGVVLEPAGAAALAAVATHDLPGERTACVLTGGNARPTYSS